MLLSLASQHSSVTFFSGVGFVLNNTAIPEHGIVTLDNIGIDGAALRCMTDNTQCCSIVQTRGVSGVGQWYFPNGTAVPNPIALSQETGMTVLPADLALYRTRDDRAVLLHHNFGGVNGIYHCEVPDGSGVTQNLYIGIFTANLGEAAIFRLLASTKRETVVLSILRVNKNAYPSMNIISGSGKSDLSYPPIFLIMNINRLTTAYL